jgi:hypothetical protein
MGKELDKDKVIINSYLLTRQEIIDIWLTQSKEHLNTLSCKYCHDLLEDVPEKKEYYCRHCDIYFVQDNFKT